MSSSSSLGGKAAQAARLASPALMVTATRPTPLQVPGQSKFWTGSHSTLGRLSVSSKLRGGRLGGEGLHRFGGTALLHHRQRLRMAG